MKMLVEFEVSFCAAVNVHVKMNICDGDELVIHCESEEHKQIVRIKMSSGKK